MSDTENRDDDRGEPVKRKRGRPPKVKRAEQEAPKPARAPTPARALKYCIASGKAITSKRGMLQAGEAVSASDFHGGQSRVDQLVAAGFIEAR